MNPGGGAAASVCRFPPVAGGLVHHHPDDCVAVRRPSAERSQLWNVRPAGDQPLNGEAQSCGGDTSPFFSLGEAIYDAKCVACHSANGGGGVGPSFIGGAVLQTFSACEDHVEWVSIGTSEWPERNLR